ncbi:hypothetical protein BB558_000818 [Smittium angustum]|uniref:CID domain-containing protein n=1 Tax=Smittium angustum TaxID=133377 RepID=A0A2U1JDF1_SMIAN|nr:hypothetical protein BB558_000818 [Smittium angustum]
MWPRKQEEIGRNRNSGFVGFMDRKSADMALKEMDGFILLGYEMKVCWGKYVPIPPKPIFENGNVTKKPSTGFPFSATIPTEVQSSHLGMITASDKLDNYSQTPEVHVIIPHDIRIKKLIHRTVEYVIRYGSKFEELLMAKELGSQRWKLYSLLNGDQLDSWKTEMFYMFSEGPIWIPPPLPYSDNIGEEHSESSEEEENEKMEMEKNKLGRVATGRLCKRLRKLDMTRGSIARTMVFAIERAEASDQIAEIITKYKFDSTTDKKSMIARLYLVSDILNNSSAPVSNAWKLRQSFEKKLEAFFEVFVTSYREIDARLKAEQFRRSVLTVLAIWESLLVFPTEFISKLALGFFQNHLDV